MASLRTIQGRNETEKRVPLTLRIGQRLEFKSGFRALLNFKRARSQSQLESILSLQHNSRFCAPWGEPLHFLGPSKIMNFLGKADSLKMVGMIEKCETTIIFCRDDELASPNVNV